MRTSPALRPVFVFCMLAAAALAQVGAPAPSTPFTPPEPKPQAPQQPAPVPVQPPAQPGQLPRPAAATPQAPPQPAGQTAPQPATQPATQPQTLPPSEAPKLTDTGSFMLPNASLTEMIDILAKRLKINYILDPAVKGSVSVFTYGEVKPVDYMPLLETILRVNGDAIVKVGDWYRIIPINKVSAMPLQPQINGDNKTLPDDERMVLNLIFLKYATATEMLNLLKPFLGEFATASVYEPANLIIIQDNARSMRRTMDLISLFDGDQFAGQRVRLFELENARPTDMAKELDQVFKAYALSDKAQAVKFLPVDRINTLIAVAPNPGIFDQVKSWIDKLDVAVATSAGSVNNYVYRLKYGRAETIAMAIMALYSGNPYALMALSAMSQMQNMGGINGIGGANGYTGNMYGGGMGMYGGGMGMYGGGMGMYGMMGGGMYPGMSPYGQAYGAAPAQQSLSPMATSNPANLNQQNPADLTGGYLGQQANAGAGPQQRMPHVIPNPFDNTILIQGTSQEYEQILKMLRQLDIAPRQVLIDAKIYEVDLTGDLAAGVSAYLEKKDTGSRSLNVASAVGLTLNTGLLVSRTKELLALVTATETTGKSRVISAPSIIATDSIPATMNVGSSVPTLTSQAVAGGVQQGGSSLFTNTISNTTTGVTLAVTPRINASGVVTLVINQQVSSPQPPAAGAAIQSPSFSNRSFQTQVTVQDGDTVAIGGIITENHTSSSGGIPFLHRIPVVGTAFGSKTTHSDRTELIIFFTPRVIYDTIQMQDATEEIRSQLKRVGKLEKDQ